MDTETRAKSLGNAKQVNGQWLASCPVPGHGSGNGDKNPSLSITETEGKVLFHCHAGCDQREVFDAVRDRNLLPTTPKREEISFTQHQHQQPVLEKEWVYRAEDGTELFTKRRYKTQDAKGKTYSIHRVDATGKRIAGLKDTRIVPLNLPEMLQAKQAGKAIYLVEGEKAADALASIGAVATTSHTGAGSWPTEITKYFTGANVVVIPDNDEPGRSYAKRAIAHLLPVVNSIRYLDLNLMMDGDDAHEWVHDMQGTRKELAELARQAEIITNHLVVTDSEQLSEAFNPVAQLLNIEAWDTIKDEPVEWIIKDVLPVRAFSILVGPPGSYKSFVALDIAEAIATGRTWMGNQVSSPGAVLYIAGEGFGGLGARIKATKINHNTKDGAEIYVIRHQLNLRSSADDFNILMESIDDLIQRTGIDLRLIQIDTLARAFGGGNENDSQDMGAFIHNCGRMQRKLDCALMAMHHSGKDILRGARGHSSLLGAVDTQLELQKIAMDEPKDGVAGRGVITLSKSKDGQDNLKFGFEMIHIDIGGSLNLGESTSLGVREYQEMIDEQHKKTKTPPLRTGAGGVQKVSLDALHKAISEHGEMRTIDGKRNKAILVEQWRKAFEASQTDNTGIKKRFERTVMSLQNAKRVEVFDPFVWVIFSDSDQNGGDF